MTMPKINTFDIDGVIYFGEEFTGVRPCEEDIIITGRSFEQREETTEMLHSRGIYNRVLMNPLTREDSRYSRLSSGYHKAQTIWDLKEKGYEIGLHFEDDPIQIEAIREAHPNLQIIHMIREGEDLIGY